MQDVAMGLTDGFVDVGLTRPDDIVEQLQWDKYERAVARHMRRVRARQRTRCRARFGCEYCASSFCSCRDDDANNVTPSVTPKTSRRGRRESGTVTHASRTNKVAPGPGPVVEMVDVTMDDTSVSAPAPRSQTMRKENSHASLDDKKARRKRAKANAQLRMRSHKDDASVVEMNRAVTLVDLPSPPPKEPRAALDKLTGGSTSDSDESGVPFGLAKVGKFIEEGFRLSDSSSDSDVYIDSDESESEYLNAIKPEPARGRISRHNDFHVLISVRTDNFMSLDMIKDAVEGFSRRRWLHALRSKYGVVNLLAQCSHTVRRWRARRLWRFALTTANQRSARLARLQATRLVNLLRDNDLAAWILELPTHGGGGGKPKPGDEENVRCEVLVAVNASRDMLIALADQAELFMERTDGRMMRFRASEAAKFKQHSATRMFNPSTAQSLVLRQLRVVTANMQRIGENDLDDCVFFLHDHDDGHGRAVVNQWIHRYVSFYS